MIMPKNAAKPSKKNTDEITQHNGHNGTGNPFPTENSPKCKVCQRADTESAPNDFAILCGTKIITHYALIRFFHLRNHFVKYLRAAVANGFGNNVLIDELAL